MKSRNLIAQTLPVLALALLAPVSVAHAAGTAGTLKAVGTLTVTGDCRILTDAKGTKYALVGKVDKLANGDQLEVIGKAAKKSSCLDGPAIQVEKAMKVKLMMANPGDAPKGGPNEPQVKIVTSTDGTLPPPPPGGPGGGAQAMLFHMNGTLIPGAAGAKCQAFRNLKGSVFNLTGDLKTFKTGDKVTLEGVSVSNSNCGPGTTVQVNSIQPIQQQ